MKNKNTDLNNILFEVIEKLNDDDLVGDKLTEEINRATSITSVATKIIDNSRLGLEAAKLVAEYKGVDAVKALPEMLQNGPTTE